MELAIREYDLRLLSSSGSFVGYLAEIQAPIQSSGRSLLELRSKLGCLKGIRLRIGRRLRIFIGILRGILRSAWALVRSRGRSETLLRGVSLRQHVALKISIRAPGRPSGLKDVAVPTAGAPGAGRISPSINSRLCRRGRSRFAGARRALGERVTLGSAGPNTAEECSRNSRRQLPIHAGSG